jgi:hypothetical protein
MGFSTILDILASVIIGGILLTIVLRLSDSAAEKTYNYSGELSLQQNLVTIAQIMESDFRKIGYSKDWESWRANPLYDKPIIEADSSSLKFYADINNDGVMDVIHYYLGPVSELASTPNPRDRFLYRVVNSEAPVGVNLGVTEFFMTYFDALGTPLTLPIIEPSLISSMEINIKVENVQAYDEKYSSAFWRQIRLAARNLKYR